MNQCSVNILQPRPQIAGGFVETIEHLEPPLLPQLVVCCRLLKL